MMIDDVKSLLAVIAETSDDPDTKTAAVLLDWVAKPSLHAANRIPTGVAKIPERLRSPLKYTFIEHAERALIAKAAQDGRSTLGQTIALNWFPCADCARIIVGAGIATLYADREKYEERKDDPRYKFADSMAMLIEAGVEVRWL